MTFWQDSIIVIALVLAVVVGLLFWRIGLGRIIPYFKTKDGQGVAKGVILAPLVILVLALLIWLLPGNANAQTLPGTWFNDASVFMGIERTKKISPQCHAGGYDERSTSNMGVRANLWQSDSGNVRLNGKYTHHSCAINPDRNSYDALGVEVEWIVWKRKR